MQNYKTSQHQQGAILLVALIMLLLITIIGTSSIGLTTLDTRMTANARDRQAAFQSAEYGLLAAESVLMPTKTLPIGDTTVGHVTGLTSEWWSNSANWGSAATVSTAEVSTSYIVTEPFDVAIDSRATVQDASLDNNRGAKLFLYTATSKAVGPGGAPALLQSVYVRKTFGNELAH